MSNKSLNTSNFQCKADTSLPCTNCHSASVGDASHSRCTSGNETSYWIKAMNLNRVIAHAHEASTVLVLKTWKFLRATTTQFVNYTHVRVIWNNYTTGPCISIGFVVQGTLWFLLQSRSHVRTRQGFRQLDADVAYVSSGILIDNLSESE